MDRHQILQKIYIYGQEFVKRELWNSIEVGKKWLASTGGWYQHMHNIKINNSCFSNVTGYISADTWLMHFYWYDFDVAHMLKQFFSRIKIPSHAITFWFKTFLKCSMNLEDWIFGFNIGTPNNIFDVSMVSISNVQ